MCIENMIKQYARNKKDLKLTIGIIHNKEDSFNVYGANGLKVNSIEHDYEIGSITKTFTTSLLAKAIFENIISLEDGLDKYTVIKAGYYAPKILQLATHTAGLGEAPVCTNLYKSLRALMKGTNQLAGYNQEMLKEHFYKKQVEEKIYQWEYSNLGISLLGLVLANCYHTTYEKLMNDFIKNDLYLKHTYLSHGTEGDLCGYWKWEVNDGYMPSGALVSRISDMLSYVKMHMNQEIDYLSMTHKMYVEVEENKMSMGLGWIYDMENGIQWHNGGTGAYRSFLGYDDVRKNAVVVLSNKVHLKDEIFTPTKHCSSVDEIGFAILKNLE